MFTDRNATSISPEESAFETSSMSIVIKLEESVEFEPRGNTVAVSSAILEAESASYT
jgi:hypothetical protein